MKKSSHEITYRFVAMMGVYAPEVVQDLFEKNDVEVWAAHWTFQCDWLQGIAQTALDEMRKAMETNPPEDCRTIAAITGFWRNASHDLFKKTYVPPFRVEVFASGESFRHLTKEEFLDRMRNSSRVERAWAAYYKKHFEGSTPDDVLSKKENTRSIWLALYISEGSERSYKKVADAVQVATGETLSEDTIGNGCREFSKLIGLTFTEERRGGKRQTDAKRRKK